MDDSALSKFLLDRNIPEDFQWPDPAASGSDNIEPVELVGTLQAANAQSVYVATGGGVVLTIPRESVISVSDARFGPAGSVRLLINGESVAESATRVLLFGGVRRDTAPLVLMNGSPDLQIAGFEDKTLERLQSIMEKLKKLGLPVPIGDDGGTTTYSYLSSAWTTTGPDGGSRSDSDPIREADD
ncbi:hypothetical protein [Paracraurococcus lichenis]|uniref:Uncharacterized protein n=1 Tax=Paracraurococcus lichenis TaxID=3064888 RepID=A0ABT9DT52_9PROT|nr:hypothetical protein [Paracraurococcus sp. LOR1-02]MDO9707078.1 hypothetical protein [Paracraurococcus sp. LOR1-02]